MGQSEVIDILEKEMIPLSVGEISTRLGERNSKIAKHLSQLLKYDEVEVIEIDRVEAMRKYNCKRRMRLWFVKGFGGATIDLSTGKISGCKEGSRVYLHEVGHKVFNETDWGARIDYWQYHFMMIAVFFGALSLVIDNLYLHIFTFLNALGMICSYLFQELWAWGYSFKNYNK